MCLSVLRCFGCFWGFWGITWFTLIHVIRFDLLDCAWLPLQLDTTWVLLSSVPICANARWPCWPALLCQTPGGCIPQRSCTRVLLVLVWNWWKGMKSFRNLSKPVENFEVFEGSSALFCLLPFLLPLLLLFCHTCRNWSSTTINCINNTYWMTRMTLNDFEWYWTITIMNLLNWFESILIRLIDIHRYWSILIDIDVVEC